MTTNSILRSFGSKVLLLAVLISAALPLQASVPDGVSVDVQLSKTSFAVNEPIFVSVTYTNTTSTAIQMLKWGTALEGLFTEDFLDVLHSGIKLPYSGRVVKRVPIKPSDFVLLLPNQSVSETVDLLDAYKVDIKGEYQVVPRGQSAQFQTSSTGTSFSLLTNRPQVAGKLTPNYLNCTAGRQSQLSSALSVAESYSRRARDDLQNTPKSERPNAQRYRKWFGAYSEGRWNIVQDRFNRIYSAASGKTMTFNCGCTDPRYYAYVYPSDHYRITLCTPYWGLPTSGTDSKAGTIVHEISHFHVSSSGQGTDDHVYRKGPAASLATNDPNKAVENADNLEYFAENSPALSMPPPGSGTPVPVPEPEPEPPVIIQILKLLLLQ